MSTKKPSAQTQLKNLRVEHTAQSQQLEKSLKDLADAKKNTEYGTTRANDAERELQQIHAFLDAVPNPPADKRDDGYTKIGAMTRLSVFLATR